MKSFPRNLEAVRPCELLHEFLIQIADLTEDNSCAHSSNRREKRGGRVIQIHYANNIGILEESSIFRNNILFFAI